MTRNGTLHGQWFAYARSRESDHPRARADHTHSQSHTHRANHIIAHTQSTSLTHTAHITHMHAHISHTHKLYTVCLNIHNSAHTLHKHPHCKEIQALKHNNKTDILMLDPVLNIPEMEKILKIQSCQQLVQLANYHTRSIQL